MVKKKELYRIPLYFTALSDVLAGYAIEMSAVRSIKKDFIYGTSDLENFVHESEDGSSLIRYEDGTPFIYINVLAFDPPVQDDMRKVLLTIDGATLSRRRFTEYKNTFGRGSDRVSCVRIPLKNGYTALINCLTSFLRSL